MTFRILFEQSGVFKNTLKELGYDAISYDIENNFNETDHVIDIFKEIDKYFYGLSNLFDTFNDNDFIIAFFPCTYFSVQNNLIWNRQLKAFRKWDDDRINKYIDNRKQKRKIYYDYFTKFESIIKSKNLKCILENPYTNNYLLQFTLPNIIIQNRIEYGDNRKKPTMFYTYNFNPYYNHIERLYTNKPKELHNKTAKGIKRSLIQKEFAYNILKIFILPLKEN